MNHVALVGMAASVLATSALALVGTAAAAPTGPSEVDDTVRTLEASGYTVIVNRTGAGQLSNCSVTAVRPGVTHQIMDTRGSDIKPLIISDTVYVDVAC